MNPTTKMDPSSWSGARIYTLGHSTRSLDELVELMQGVGIGVLLDIRTIPRSRHNPQFNSDTLSHFLNLRGLGYVHLPELGGLRRARKHSRNIGWRNASFRGFADYMLTEQFETGLAKLRALISDGTVALMCAEAVPWRCHRSLVADALTARGTQVEHLIGSSHPSSHRLTRFAKVKDARVTYPGETNAGVRLACRAPFHLEATVRVLQRRSANLVDVWKDGHYYRVLTTAHGLVLVEVMNHGTIDNPDIRFSIRSGNPSTGMSLSIAQTVRKVLRLDMNAAPLHRMADTEPALRPTALALRGMRAPRYPALFETFANVVPFQQLSLDAGVSIVGRLVKRFGKHIEQAGRRFYAFPAAPAIANAGLEALRECGLSGAKAKSLQYIAKAIESGELTEGAISNMNTSDALATLAKLPGIGPWSAGVVLLRGFGRLDVFPPGDVGAQRALSNVLLRQIGNPLNRVIKRWGDYRGYLYFYALGSNLLARGLIHPAPESRLPGLC